MEQLHLNLMKNKIILLLKSRALIYKTPSFKLHGSNNNMEFLVSAKWLTLQTVSKKFQIFLAGLRLFFHTG